VFYNHRENPLNTLYKENQEVRDFIRLCFI